MLLRLPFVFLNCVLWNLFDKCFREIDNFRKNLNLCKLIMLFC